VQFLVKYQAVDDQYLVGHLILDGVLAIALADHVVLRRLLSSTTVAATGATQVRHMCGATSAETVKVLVSSVRRRDHVQLSIQL
jgi:hypothetical protein